MTLTPKTRWLNAELAKRCQWIADAKGKYACPHAELEQLELIELLTDADLDDQKADLRTEIGRYGISPDGYRLDANGESWNGERAHVPMAELLGRYLASLKEAA